MGRLGKGEPVETSGKELLGRWLVLICVTLLKRAGIACFGHFQALCFAREGIISSLAIYSAMI